MNRRHRKTHGDVRERRRLTRTVGAIDRKCDRILGILLDGMRRDGADPMLESIRETARAIYQCSLEERRRNDGQGFGILRHD